MSLPSRKWLIRLVGGPLDGERRTLEFFGKYLNVPNETGRYRCSAVLAPYEAEYRWEQT